MFSYLVVILLGYMLYNGVTMLIEHEGPFGTAQWITLAMCILYVPFIIFSAIRAVKSSKESKEKRAEEEAKQREELAARKKRFYLDDNDEMEYKNNDADDETADDGEVFEAEVVEEDADEADD